VGGVSLFVEEKRCELSDKEKATDQPGFCPKVVETFFMCAEVIFGDRHDLRGVLEHLRAGQLVLALASVKVLRYRPEWTGALCQAVEQRVYDAMNPQVEIAK
jgi:hypothetical protein